MNRDEIRRDLVRLLEGPDLYRSWRLSVLKRHNPDVTEGSIKTKVVMPGSFWLELFEDTKDRRCLQVLKEERAWYSHTDSDLSHFANLSEVGHAEVDLFLRDFRRSRALDSTRKRARCEGCRSSHEAPQDRAGSGILRFEGSGSDM